jgi:aspartyl-tRNA(Asn)/glutamyl-tRNA(Gln) amidotransferase subunit C
MQVTDELIDRLAHLCKLQFNDAAKAGIRNDLQQVLGMVEKLNELNLEGVAPLLHISEEQDVWRADEVKGSVSTAEGLQNAPLHNEHYFKVPKVISK